MRAANSPSGELVQDLADEAEALEHFIDAHHETRFQVAARIQRHLDRILFIGCVGCFHPNVPGHIGGARGRADRAHDFRLGA